MESKRSDLKSQLFNPMSMFSSVWFQPKQFLTWETKCIAYTSCSKLLIPFPLHSLLSLLEAVIFIHLHVLLCLAQCLAHFHSAIMHMLPLLSLFCSLSKAYSSSSSKVYSVKRFWIRILPSFFRATNVLCLCLNGNICHNCFLCTQVFFAPQRGQSAIRRWIDLCGESAAFWSQEHSESHTSYLCICPHLCICPPRNLHFANEEHIPPSSKVILFWPHSLSMNRAEFPSLGWPGKIRLEKWTRARYKPLLQSSTPSAATVFWRLWMRVHIFDMSLLLPQTV